MERRETRRGIDVKRGDLLRGVDRDLFDIHPAFGRGDEGHASEVAIDDQREIKLPLDGDVLGHIDFSDRPALRPGLRRDQRLAQHALGVAAQIFKALHQLDAAAFASAAGMDLRLQHPSAGLELARGDHRLLRRGRNMTLRDRSAVIAQQRLRLIFVNVHGTPGRFAIRRRARPGSALCAGRARQATSPTRPTS